jgi:hypothetical protein
MSARNTRLREYFALRGVADMRLGRTLFVAVLTLAFACPAEATLTTACYTNSSEILMYFAIYFNNHIVAQVVQPMQTAKEGADTDGIYCISSTPVSDPRECPINTPNTQSGFLVELPCP